MPKLPVFSTIGQAIAVFGLHIGTLLKWALIPLSLGIVALAVGGGSAAGLAAMGMKSGVFWIPMVPAALFAVLATVPFAIRVNQLAVLGRVEQTGYLGMIFSHQSFRYVGYGLLTGGIVLGCLALLSVPTIAVGAMIPKKMESLMGVVGVLVSLALLPTLGILLSPLHLIFPAVAVEQHPALGKAFALGSHARFRLFLCIVLSALACAIPSMLIQIPVHLLGVKPGSPVMLALIPLQLCLSFFSYVVTVSVTGVAYRVLSGLPDPYGPQTAGDEPTEPAAAPQPGEGQGEAVAPAALEPPVAPAMADAPMQPDAPKEDGPGSPPEA